MEQKTLYRYLSALIKHKAPDKAYLPKTFECGDDRVNLMFKVITELRNNNSAMSQEIIMGTVREKFLEIADMEQWMENESWFESLIYTSEDLDVSKDEIAELYGLLQREKINQVAKKIISSLVDQEITEERLTKAIEKLRVVKAVYPSKSVKLDEQTSKAVIEALTADVIPYYIPDLDDELVGLVKGEITILAGRPSHGKTSFAVQLIINFLENGHKVLFISKEMSTSKLIQKMISNIGNISSKSIKKGEVEDEEYLQAVAQAIVTKYRESLFVYDDVYNWSEIENLIIKHKPEVVVDDYIQITDFAGCGEKEKRDKIGFVMRYYKELVKEYEIAWLELSQLSRAIESRDDPVPRMSDLSESASLEQVSSDVLFIYYPYKDTYKPQDKSRVLIIVGKARYGENVMLDVGFDGDHMRYYQLPKLKRSAS